MARARTSPTASAPKRSARNSSASRRRAREAEASERRYRSLAEAIPQIVWTARPDGHVDYLNRRWFEYTGLSEAESGGRDAWRDRDPPRRRRRAPRALGRAPSQTGDVFEMECRFRRKADGALSLASLPRRFRCAIPTAASTKWFGTCTDIDDQKRSGEAMRQAQKLESIGLLAGGVAHDFNNLLTGILGNTSLALDELPANSRLRPMLENVMLASERAADLTRQLLAYSGKGRFFVQSSDLSVLVREIGSLIQSSIPKKVQLRLDLAARPAARRNRQRADPAADHESRDQWGRSDRRRPQRRRRRQHATARRGCSSSSSNNHFAVDAAIPPGRYVAIQVRDNGCGMDEFGAGTHLRPVLHHQIHGSRLWVWRRRSASCADTRAASASRPSRARGRCSRCCSRPANARAGGAQDAGSAARTARRRTRSSWSTTRTWCAISPGRRSSTTATR